MDFNIFFMLHSITIIILNDNVPFLAIGSPSNCFSFDHWKVLQIGFCDISTWVEWTLTGSLLSSKTRYSRLIPAPNRNSTIFPRSLFAFSLGTRGPPWVGHHFHVFSLDRTRNMYSCIKEKNNSSVNIHTSNSNKTLQFFLLILFYICISLLLLINMIT